VTPAVEEDSPLDGGLLAGIIIFSIFVILAAIWVTLNIVSKKCPNSNCGRKINDWKAKRALSKE